MQKCPVQSPERVTTVATGLWPVRISKSSTEFDRSQPGGYGRKLCSGLWSGHFWILGLLFLRLTHYGRDRLKFFVIAQIH